MSTIDTLIAAAKTETVAPQLEDAPEDAIEFVEAARAVRARLVAAAVECIEFAGWSITTTADGIQMRSSDSSEVGLAEGPPIWIPIRPALGETKRDTLTAAASALNAILEE